MNEVCCASARKAFVRRQYKNQLLKTLAASFFVLNPSVSYAEVLELECFKGTSVETTKLLFDAETKRVKYGDWPWSGQSSWLNDAILWTAISSSTETAGSFYFQRKTNRLAVEVVSKLHFVWV